jgi:adenylate cyclase class IV
MKKNNIEVEIRSFISKEQYNELLKFFNKEATLVKKDKQKTIYFDSKQDLRIQKNNSTTKVWIKKGKVHDNFREEIEIHTKKEDFENAFKIYKRDWGKLIKKGLG